MACVRGRAAQTAAGTCRRTPAQPCGKDSGQVDELSRDAFRRRLVVQLRQGSTQSRRMLVDLVSSSHVLLFPAFGLRLMHGQRAARLSLFCVVLLLARPIFASSMPQTVFCIAPDSSTAQSCALILCPGRRGDPLFPLADTLEQARADVSLLCGSAPRFLLKIVGCCPPSPWSNADFAIDPWRNLCLARVCAAVNLTVVSWPHLRIS